MLATAVFARGMQEGNLLEAVGLTNREITVYQALLTRPGADVARIAAESGLLEAEVGKVLLRLAQDGLVVQSGTRYEAAAPDVALGELIGRQEQRLSAARLEMQRLTQMFRDAGAPGDTGAVEMISGASAVSARVNRVCEAARDQVRTFDRPPYVQRIGQNLALQQRRHREGVSIRTIYSRDALALPGRFQDDIELSCASGEQARVRPSLPTKLILADESIAVVPTAMGEAFAEAAYVIRSSALLAALAALFEHEWAKAVPLVTTPRRSVEQMDQPDEKTRALLGLLAGGLTDEAIARALGWSARTTQRRIAALHKELGVSTRFQAGAAARDRGWL
jgi:sugar-specific transcriptional regulator TrmB/DNA-binding CsgD family transcriptional regulator